MPKPYWYPQAREVHLEFFRRAQKSGRLQTEEELRRFFATAIAGEAGELANLFKKEWRGDGPVDHRKVSHEMADIRLYLEHLATVMEIDLDVACAEKIAIVQKRLKKKE